MSPAENNTPSQMDVSFWHALRENIKNFLRDCAAKFDGPGKTVLDVAPQDYEGAREFFKLATVKTLDLNPHSGADYIADLCKTNANLIPPQSFDYVVCTEVLEHTLQPWRAVEEMHRILRPAGTVIITVPFNFYIHPPYPDYWRFTSFGLEALLADKFEGLQIWQLETPNRPFMPIQFMALARKAIE
jgi:SAM-dependent methyltransferase